MPNRIARLVEVLLLRLLPAASRHRSASALPATWSADAPTPVRPYFPVRHAGLLHGEDSALVRPYILTPEERRALWPAVHGIDAGPRRIYGVEAMV
ncbi:hypothetical protein [Streptomyces sp. 769]|uniref:hypothetical protein n=1 Tax=Streptomyces sp. 769 TaxID=1262452 RepID=UPI000582017B|nr:hypothetical protein [Streptomyces sp. 769]AJC58756.1 hypothetical protein GZL_06186 [Streptomyces sp. 769]